MPVYTYRREDGTTFDYRQKFLDDPLIVDPETGQRVVRVIQPAGVIFKGSGFYVNDSKSASRSAVTSTPKSDKEKTEHKSDSADRSEKSEKSEKSAAPAATTEAASKPATAPAAAAAD